MDWVVQVDAPEDSAMYIHRVGRTARYNAGGRALMLLMDCEEKAVLKELTDVCSFASDVIVFSLAFMAGQRSHHQVDHQQ